MILFSVKNYVVIKYYKESSFETVPMPTCYVWVWGAEGMDVGSIKVSVEGYSCIENICSSH